MKLETVECSSEDRFGSGNHGDLARKARRLQARDRCRQLARPKRDVAARRAQRHLRAAALDLAPYARLFAAAAVARVATLRRRHTQTCFLQGVIQGNASDDAQSVDFET